MNEIGEHVSTCVCHGNPQKDICRYHRHPFTDAQCEALSRGVHVNVVLTDRQSKARAALKEDESA